MNSMWWRNAAAAVAVGLAGLTSVPQMIAADQPPAVNPAPGGQPGGGGGRGGRGGPGGPGGNPWAGMMGGHQSQTAVPGALHVVENLVDSWRVNPIDAQRPDQVANFRGNPPTVPITSLIEVDDATVEKIAKLADGADTRAKELVIKYGAKVDKLYRTRLESAKNLLSEEDQKFFAALLKGWDTCDEATRKITEPDAAKRAEELKAARNKALDEYLKSMKPEHSGRLLKVFASHTPQPLNALSPDADLCVFWGEGRLEWAELFTPADGDAEKIKTFNADYVKARDLERDAFRKELQELYNKIRDEIIAALPNEADRNDLAKVAKWSNEHADVVAEIQKQFMDLGQQFRAGGQGGAQPDWQALRTQGDELRTKMNELRTEFETQWPDRFKEKVPQAQGWGGGQGGPGGGRGNRGNRGGRGGGDAPQGGGANPGGGGGNGGDAGEF